MKRRTVFICTIAVVLSLIFVAPALAKYAGYAYNNPVRLKAGDPPQENPYPGYLSWSGANEIYKRTAGSSAVQDTPHGNYVSSTTKCAVCHSAHRAYAESATKAGDVVTSTSLTVKNGCANCHTAWGAGSANKKIEWANTTLGLSSGPHNSFGCTADAGRNGCHTGGIHGGNASAYHGMNVFMLGNQKDADIATGVAAGNVNPYRFSPNALFEDGKWFFSGTTTVPSGGNAPSDLNDPTDFAAAKGNATGYTCAQEGCHTSGQFAVNTWGFAANKAGDPSKPKDMNTPMTGHGVGSMFVYADLAKNGRCGPCHSGNYSGGWRYETNMVISPNPANSRSYGCDQCHDMVGQATNSTAWPHGNRNISVWEWDKAGTRLSVNQRQGNLWMYASNIARITPYSAFDNKAYIPTDPSYRVVNDATGYETGRGIGNINDGVCLKCHVAIDAGSKIALGGSANGPINPAVGNTHQNVDENGVFTLPKGFSKHLWLYK